ncbi:MAG: curli production assembly protein CsgG [Acidobacteriaceae bacterium]|nr:curli production assembly protein CsgG [Acidobacteriaceae bacterium]
MRQSRLLTIAPLFLCTLAYPQSPKKRIAVFDFDYAAVQNVVSEVFGTRQDVGKGIADLLVDRLVSDGRYSVIERKAIQKVMAEQNFSNSDRVDPNSAAKLGRILGVDAIVIGSITQFGRDDQNRTIGGSAFSGFAARYGIGGVGQRKAKAVVAINARLVSTDTAEILAVASGKGESTRSGTTLLGAGASGGNGGSGAYDMSSRNFSETIIGEAVGQAVTQAASGLEQSATQLPAHVVTVSGLVADVSGKTLIINVGSKAGIKLGDHLLVKRTNREVTDPATGKVIRRIEESVGELTITEVDEASAVGTYTGSGLPKIGDTVGSPGQ